MIPLKDKELGKVVFKSLELGAFNSERLMYLSERQNWIWIHTGSLLLSLVVHDSGWALIPSVLALVVLGKIVSIDYIERKRLKEFNENYETSN